LGRWANFWQDRSGALGRAEEDWRPAVDFLFFHTEKVENALQTPRKGFLARARVFLLKNALKKASKMHEKTFKSIKQ
jgi:hypothetical protein